MNLLEATGLCKTYGKGDAAVKALRDVSFSVPKGEYVTIVGESGSGKSTLLNMIGALDTPTSGEVIIDGKDIFSMNDRKLTVFRRRNIGFIFQAFNLVPELTVEQNIVFPLLLMTASFAFSILLFLAFSVVVSFTHHALTPLRPYAPDLELLHSEQRNTLDAALAAQIGDIPGVKHVFGRSYMGQVPVQGPKGMTAVDVISYDRLQLDWAGKDVVAGNIEALLQDGNAVMTVFDKHTALSEPLAVGDRFRIHGVEVEVACILSDSPFDSDGTPTLLCNEQTFARLFGSQGYAVIDIQTENGFSDRDVEGIRALAGEGVSLSDRRSSNREVTATYWAFSILVYSFLFIVAMITVFHIMNSISMSVSARMRAYGAMRAVGMDIRQLTRMIAAEALTYALSGCFVGCAAGIPLHRFLYQKMISDYWGELWYLPAMPLAVVLVLVLATALLAVMAPARRICHTPITEIVNEL